MPDDACSLTSPEGFRDVVATNLSGYFLVARVVVPADDICQITVEPGITISAPRATGREIQRHKPRNYS